MHKLYVYKDKTTRMKPFHFFAHLSNVNSLFLHHFLNIYIFMFFCKLGIDHGQHGGAVVSMLT